MRKRTWVALLATGLVTRTLAGELPGSFRGIRPLGMGGAFTAVADDENALFYNPAGLDKVKRRGMSFFNPLVQMNQEGLVLAKTVRGSDFDYEETVEFLRHHAGETGHGRVSLFPYIYTHNFAMGLLGQADLVVQPRDAEPDPVMLVDGFGIASANMGLGFGIIGGMVRLGGAAKYVHGFRLQEVYPAAEIAGHDMGERMRDDTEDGQGLGFDAGAMIELPLLFRPTVAAAVQNISGLDLGAAGRIPQQVNVGVSLRQSLFGFTFTGASDYLDAPSDPQVLEQLDLQDLVSDEFTKRLHFGLEARFPRLVTLRTGFSEGYPSYGAALELAILRLEFATYISPRGHARQGDVDPEHDREALLQLTVGW